MFCVVSSPCEASSGSYTQRSLFAGASKKALETSAIRMLLPLPFLSTVPKGASSTVATQLSRILNASSGGVAANRPSPTLSLNYFPTVRRL